MGHHSYSALSVARCQRSIILAPATGAGTAALGTDQMRIKTRVGLDWGHSAAVREVLVQKRNPHWGVLTYTGERDEDVYLLTHRIPWQLFRHYSNPGTVDSSGLGCPATILSKHSPESQSYWIQEGGLYSKSGCIGCIGVHMFPKWSFCKWSRSTTLCIVHMKFLHLKRLPCSF